MSRVSSLVYAPGRVLPSRAQAQLLDELLVAVPVGSCQILQEIGSMAHQYEQTPARTVVLLVYLQMTTEVLDAFRQKRNLNLGATCILLVQLELADDPLFPRVPFF